MEQYKSLIEMGLWVIVATMGWFMRELWAAVKSLKEDIRSIERDLPVNYIRRDDYKDDMKEIKDMLGKIFDRLENKADK
jgi:cobalamin biosynthesis Co2+ chelatase CbiK